MKNRELIQALYAAFATRDTSVMMSFLDDQVKWTEAEGFPYAGTHIGPKAVRDNVWRRMGTEWRNWDAKPDMFLVDGDRAAVSGTYTGTYKSTGKAIRARFAHIFELRGGKIIHFEQFVDSAKVNEALR